MAIKEIALHQGFDSRSRVRLDVAVNLAKAHKARVIGVFAKGSADAGEYSWAAFGTEQMARLLSNLENEAAKVEHGFRTRMEEEGLECEWRVVGGDATDSLLIRARSSDLTVIGQTDPGERHYDGGTPEHLVLGAGGPVLVVPYAGEFTTIGRRVMIAWNGTREAARAVRDAMPILRRADKVVVYSITAARHRPVSGADISAYLTRHGISGQAEHIVRGSESEAVASSLKTVGDFGSQETGAWSFTRHPAIGQIGVGDALLSAVAECSVDLLVMGAYGHSRVRELVLGGATRKVLETMTVPVVFSN